MSFERKDFTDSLREKVAGQKQEQRAALEMLKRAALSTDMLTGDPAWDEFLSYVQYHVEAINREKAAAMAQLMNPGLHDPNALANVRMLIIRLSERMEVLTQIIALPKKIKEIGAGAAAELIKRDLEDAAKTAKEAA